MTLLKNSVETLRVTLVLSFSCWKSEEKVSWLNPLKEVCLSQVKVKVKRKVKVGCCLDRSLPLSSKSESEQESESWLFPRKKLVSLK